MAEWQDGIMEDWQDGRMAGWQNGMALLGHRMTGMRAAQRKLRDLLHTLSYEPREGLLQMAGLGASRVEKILQKCEEVGRPLGMQDVLGIPRMGPGTVGSLVGDPLLPAVVKYVLYYQKVVGESKCMSQERPKNVVSVDLGIFNSAYAHVDADLRVHRWKKLSLCMPKPYSPERCYEEVNSCLDELPPAEAYIIEAQSHRNPRSQGFLAVSVELRTLEAMLFAVAKQRKERVYSILPKRTAQYFGIGGNTRKRASVELVKELIRCERATPLGDTVTLSEELAEYFDKETKKDDLSDCLLQAVAFLEWSQMAVGL